MEKISPDLLLFFRTHGWGRCFELYFLQMTSDKLKLLFHKRIRYNFCDIFFDCNDRRRFVIYAFDHDERNHMLWMGRIEGKTFILIGNFETPNNNSLKIFRRRKEAKTCYSTNGYSNQRPASIRTTWRRQISIFVD